MLLQLHLKLWSSLAPMQRKKVVQTHINVFHKQLKASKVVVFATQIIESWAFFMVGIVTSSSNYYVFGALSL